LDHHNLPVVAGLLACPAIHTSLCTQIGPAFDGPDVLVWYFLLFGIFLLV
jgi:hypothetical protein